MSGGSAWQRWSNWWNLVGSKPFQAISPEDLARGNPFQSGPLGGTPATTSDNPYQPAAGGSLSSWQNAILEGLAQQNGIDQNWTTGAAQVEHQFASMPSMMVSTLNSVYAMQQTAIPALAATLASVQASTNAVSSSTAALAGQVLDIWRWASGAELPSGHVSIGSMSLAQLYDWIWNQPDPLTSNVRGAEVDAAGAAATDLAWRGLQRMADAPMFLIDLAGADQTSDLNVIYDLRSIDPKAQRAGEADVDFLNRVAGSHAWSASNNGTPFAGLTQLTAEGYTIDYYYAPVGSSAWPFARVADYTPASGPPARNAFADLVMILAMLPIQFPST